MSLLDLQATVVADLIANLGLPAEKAFVPEITLESTENLRVIVVPVQVESVTRISRNNDWEEVPQVQIGVVQRVQPNAAIPVTEEDILNTAESIRTRYKQIRYCRGWSLHL